MGFTMLDPETLAEFEAGVFRGAERVLDGLVEAYRGSHPELDERFTRAVISAALLSVGIAEYQRIGFTLPQAQRKLAEAWAASEKSATR